MKVWPVMVARNTMHKYALLFFFLASWALPSCSSDGAVKTIETQAVEDAVDPPKVQRKLLLFGIDGATWDLMDPLLAAGRLPNFAALIERGVKAPLKTYTPTASPLIWTSIATGVTPELHGITDFTFKVPGSDETLLPTSNMRRAKAIWNILSDRGYGVGVVGWWATYPAEKVNGFMVSDQAVKLRTDSYHKALNLNGKNATTASLETYPPEFDQEIEKAIVKSDAVGIEHISRFIKLGKDRLDALKAEESIDVEDIESIFKFALLIDQSYVESAVVGIEKFKPDFATVYVNGLDAVEHHFWKYFEPAKFKDVPVEEIARYRGIFDEYHVYMDEVLGRLLNLYAQEELTVIVVSDHGHHANPAYDPQSTDHYNRICSGDHNDAPDGILIMAGKDIVKGARPSAPSVYDIAPTVLALMGTRNGKHMMGRALVDVIAPEFIKLYPVAGGADYSGRSYTNAPVRAPMGEALKDKLKGLGYIK
jgi:predicted AlkP superfamily phosphohydrolase/phosphomutase